MVGSAMGYKPWLCQPGGIKQGGVRLTRSAREYKTGWGHLYNTAHEAGVPQVDEASQPHGRVLGEAQAAWVAPQ